MRNLKVVMALAAVVVLAGVPVAYFSTTTDAQAQAQSKVLGTRPSGECVTFGNSASLQMCIHNFADGTRCVAAGGGGHAQAGASGAGVALQCNFK